jgi:simple sugar transport system ATP-binding protein
MSATTDTVLELQGVTKRFGPVVALRDVSLTLRAGEVLGLVGDNGAGKSTLVNIMSGNLRPDEGQILVDGEPRRFHSPADARAAGLETVFQNLALIPTLNIVDNVYLRRELYLGGTIGKALRLMNKRGMRRETSAGFDRLGVTLPPLKSKVGALSGGQRQAVAICRAAGFGSRIVIMDEPTAALGHRETHRAEELIASLRDRGLAVLLISHDFAQVQRLAQRVWVMRGGRVTACLGANDVSTERLVAMVTGAEED